MTGLSIIIGFSLGLSPLCSQAFGACNYKRCGHLLQRQLCIHLLIILPFIILVWINSEYILISFFHQPYKISKLCSIFLYWRIPALPFYCINEDFIIFIKSQKVFIPTMLISICLGIFTVILASFLILPKMQWGLGFGKQTVCV